MFRHNYTPHSMRHTTATHIQEPCRFLPVIHWSQYNKKRQLLRSLRRKLSVKMPLATDAGEQSIEAVSHSPFSQKEMLETHGIYGR